MWAVLMPLIVAIEATTGRKSPVAKFGGVGRGIDGERDTTLQGEGVGALFEIGDPGLCCTWPRHHSDGSLVSVPILLLGEVGFAIRFVEIDVMVARDDELELRVDASEQLQCFLVGAVDAAVMSQVAAVEQDVDFEDGAAKGVGAVGIVGKLEVVGVGDDEEASQGA